MKTYRVVIVGPAQKRAKDHTRYLLIVRERHEVHEAWRICNSRGAESAPLQSFDTTPILLCNQSPLPLRLIHVATNEGRMNAHDRR